MSDVTKYLIFKDFILPITTIIIVTGIYLIVQIIENKNRKK